MPQVKEGVSLTNAHRFYTSDGGVVTKSIYRKVCQDFNDMLVNELMEGRTVKLPHGLGKLTVVKYKINWKRPPIDFHATKKLGHTVYHTNTHSDGYCAKVEWKRRKRLIKNLFFYEFDITWSNSKRISQQMMKEDGHKIFQVQE